MTISVKVKEKNTHQVLFECALEDLESAYQFMSSLEEMGSEGYLEAPTITETLCHALGVSDEEEEMYHESVSEELEDHDGSCCFKE